MSFTSPLRFTFALALSSSICVGSLGCDKEDGEGNALDGIAPTDLAEGWNEIKTGGETICAKGDEYSFFVRPGTVNKVVVDFIGGGACWNAETCGLLESAQLFVDKVDSTREMLLGGDAAGIYDDAKAENPFKDWYHVVIPYCTGDVHWGNITRTYGEGEDSLEIAHQGATNARAVLDWVYGNFTSPEQLMVTGCSAGAYGSAMWAPYLAEYYADSDLIQFGDSGAGIITPDWFAQSFPSWSANASFPAWIPEFSPENIDLENLSVDDLYRYSANYYPEHRFSQFNTQFDSTQALYFEAMGGGGADIWSEEMKASQIAIAADSSNFSYMVGAGTQHCIIGYDNFYTEEVQGQTLLSWINDLIDNVPVNSKICDDC